MGSNKRARKKQHRDRRHAARAAALRRRKFQRLVAVAIVIALLVSLGLGLTAGRDDDPPDADPPQAAPELPEGCAEVDLPEPQAQQYDDPPDLSVAEGVDYRALIRTSCGDIEVDLLQDQAPMTVANFVFLAREGYYDGLLWHRIERNFVIQTGDPNNMSGVPPDGPGYTIPDELEGIRPRDYTYGTVAMANAGPDTGGSQFFVIVHTDAEGSPEPAGLQPLYSIFGTVAEGSHETLERIRRTPTQVSDNAVEAVMPAAPVIIETIEIVEA
jgi:cyclophilin family peptidyl-prolyl cis-trans isomerase